jgi:hypothetical protein
MTGFLIESLKRTIPDGFIPYNFSTRSESMSYVSPEGLNGEMELTLRTRIFPKATETVCGLMY